MIAASLISDTIPSVKLTDSVEKVLDWMGEYKIGQLPIISERSFRGMVKENDLLDAENPKAKIQDILYLNEEMPYVSGQNLFVGQSAHIFEVMSVMSQYQSDTLAVLDLDKHYAGLISARDVVNHLGEVFAVEEEGSTVIIETTQNNYSLAEIGRIVESTDAKVLSMYVHNIPDTAQLEITLKVNVLNPSRIIAAFERFKYVVKMSYFHAEAIEDYKRNLNALMQMLD